jgi:DNA-binding NarL/FixJ family response regulator
MAITVMIVHPDRPEREAMRDVLASGARVGTVVLAGDDDEALDLAQRLCPTVTLLDDRVRTFDGGPLVTRLANWSRVVVLTGTTEQDALTRTLRAPVRGCLVYGHFEPMDLLDAVHAVADGLAWLSPVAASAATRALRRRVHLAEQPPRRAQGIEGA